ncbi:unnamed protein product [Parnassius mnemosyne]|uniref:SPIN-DOC-like zinc-finger domain-containing protein n=1 Tax=Parnassius mnemosyne TaxID=213953 RepID=A0AAV1LME0_9NEOP
MDKPGPIKKRKVKDENLQFQEIWTAKYFFVWSHNKVVCLICKNSVAIAKEYNVKKHYEMQHPTFTKFTGELRKQKMLSLKRELIGQQAMFTKPIQDSETATEVSYEISRINAKRSRPFNDGDFVKECIEIAAKKMCPDAAKKFEKIQLNRMTIQRRIMSLSVENAPESLQLEIIDIQNDQDLRNKFNEGDLLNFYRCIDKNTYKELRISALKCASLFGSTYICEQTF